MLRLMPEAPGSSQSGWFTAEAYPDVYSTVRVTFHNSGLLSVGKVTCRHWDENSASCGSKLAVLCELLCRVACAKQVHTAFTYRGICQEKHQIGGIMANGDSSNFLFPLLSDVVSTGIQDPPAQPAF